MLNDVFLGGILMRIQSMECKNNNPNFGINYANKSLWNQGVLKAFEKSNLVKEIDCKYPEARVHYSKQNITGMDLGNDEPDYLASLIIQLAKGKIATLNINSHSSAGADNALKRYINAASLEEVEKRAKDRVEMPKYSVEINPVKKQNPIARFFSKIFG